MSLGHTRKIQSPARLTSGLVADGETATRPESSYTPAAASSAPLVTCPTTATTLWSAAKSVAMSIAVSPSAASSRMTSSTGRPSMPPAAFISSWNMRAAALIDWP